MNTLKTLLSVLLSVSLFASACAPELVLDQENTTSDASQSSEKTPTEPSPNAGTQIDASGEDSWTYFSLVAGKTVKVKDPATSKDWDLGFRRFVIMTNGGVSGKGGVKVAVLKDKDWNDVTTAPKDGYVEDKKDGDDPNKDVDSPFNVGDYWFSYKVKDHTLTPRRWIFVIRATDGLYYKFQLTGYYDKSGNGGFPAFRWAKLPLGS
jgi:hypothetical protein